MKAETKIEILREVYDCSEFLDVQYSSNSILHDLQRFTQDVLTDGVGEWEDDEIFIDIIMDNFSDEHPLWEYICLI